MVDDRDVRIAQLEAEFQQARAENAALREQQTASGEILSLIASSPPTRSRCWRPSRTAPDGCAGRMLPRSGEPPRTIL